MMLLVLALFAGSARSYAQTNTEQQKPRPGTILESTPSTGRITNAPAPPR